MFLVSSGTMIFLLPENVILFYGRKMKDDLSQKILGNMMFSVYQIHGNIIFSSNVLKRWSFQKKPYWNMIFLVSSGKKVPVFVLMFSAY